jgi:hypothetical protein
MQSSRTIQFHTNRFFYNHSAISRTLIKQLTS